MEVILIVGLLLVVIVVALAVLVLVVTIVLLVVVVILIVVVVTTLVCTGVIINTFVEVLAVDMRVGMVIIASDMAVKMDAFTALMRGVLNNTDVGVLLDVNLNVLTDAMTAFEVVMS